MPDLTDVPPDAYHAAIAGLAQCLVGAWAICEIGYEGKDPGLGAGDLPQALSYALGLAAATLGADRDADGNLINDDRSRKLAVEALVRHQPGSWEAEHVRALALGSLLLRGVDL